MSENTEPKTKLPRPKPLRIAIALFVVFVLYHGVEKVKTGLSQAAPAGLPPISEINETAGKSLARMLDYSDKGFKLKYPANWEIKSDPPPPQAVNIRVYKGVVNTNVIVDTLEPSTTLDRYSQALIDGIKQLVNKCKLLSSENIDLHGTPGRRLIYSNEIKAGENVLMLRQVVTVAVKNGKGYTLTSSTLDEWYPSFEKVFMAISNSLELDEQPAPLEPAKSETSKP